jgi:photosystem II stability/assembly factor-like uncharacterized protein
MTRNAARFSRLIVCLVTLSLANLAISREADQPVSVDAAILDALVARNIGPANMGGRTVAIAGVDSDPNVVYVGTASGGLWKTTDSGATWKGLFDNQTSVCIGDVAVSQSNPDIVWVGTGEANARNSVAWGDGVYKSVDGGSTWTNMGLRDSHSIGRIAIHPKDPNIVYVAALGHLWGPNKERGVFKTTDGGKTWDLCKFIDENTGFIDLKMDPAEPDILYAAAYCVRRNAFSGGNPTTVLGPGAGLYKTSDGGKKWAKMEGGLPTNRYGRCGLDIYRKDPNIIYAVVQTEETTAGEGNSGNKQNGTGSPKAGGIFRSEDKGATWKHVNTLCPRPFYFGQVRIDPSDDKRIYVLGVQMFISDDAGKKFDPLGGAGTGGGKGLHADHHALWVNPKDSTIVWLGNDGGVDISRDKAKTFRGIRAMSLGQFYGISADMSKPYYVYGGLQDNGGWGGPSATYDKAGIRLSQWFTISGGDGFHTQSDPTDPNIVYTESQYGNPSRANVASKGKGGKGGKGGGGKGGMSVKGFGGRFNWSTPMLLSPHDPKTFFYGGNFLLMSTERGSNFKKISPNLTYGPDTGKSADNGHTLFTIGESPKKKGVIWTGADDGCIFVTTDGGDMWTDVSAIPLMPKESCISRVEPSHFDEATCYVSITRYRNDDRKPYIFKTTDYGSTWQNVTGNLPPSGSVHVVIESSRNKNLLFCGTEFGLFVTLDGGVSWRPMKSGLPTVAVHDLVIHPRERDLILGTHGRSVIVIDDIGPLEQMTPELLAKPSHFFSVRPTTAFQWQDSQPPAANEFAGKNPEYGALLRYYLKAGVPQPVSITITDSMGAQIATLKGDSSAGLHQIVWNLQADGKTTTVAAGEYWALLNAATQKQYQKIHVEAEPKPEKKDDNKGDKKDDKGDKKDDKGDKKGVDKDKKGPDKADDKADKKADDKKKDGGKGDGDDVGLRGLRRARMDRFSPALMEGPRPVWEARDEAICLATGRWVAWPLET